MTDSAAIYLQLTEIFEDIFMRPGIVLTATTSSGDIPSWDSFKQIEIVMAVEERFGVKFSARDLDSLQNVGDLVMIIEERA